MKYLSAYIKYIICFFIFFWTFVGNAAPKSNAIKVMGLSELNDSLLKYKNQKYSDIALMYLNCTKRPLDSAENLLLQSIVKLLNDPGASKIIISSVTKSPIAELDFNIAQMLNPPTDAADNSLYDSLVRCAYNLRGSFIEEKVNSILAASNPSQNGITTKVIKDCWEILCNIDCYTYVKSCLKFYWSDTSGYKILEQDRATQEFIESLIKKYSNSDEYFIYLKDFADKGYSKNEQAYPRKVHYQFNNEIDENLSKNNTPVSISTRLALIDFISSKQSERLLRQAKQSIFNEWWLYPSNVLSNSELMKKININSIKKNSAPPIFDKNNFFALQQYILVDSIYYRKRDSYPQPNPIMVMFGGPVASSDQYFCTQLANRAALDYGMSPIGNFFLSSYDSAYLYNKYFMNMLDIYGTAQLYLQLGKERSIQSDSLNTHKGDAKKKNQSEQSKGLNIVQRPLRNKGTNQENFELTKAHATLMVNQELFCLALNVNFLLESKLNNIKISFDTINFFNKIMAEVNTTKKHLRLRTNSINDSTRMLISADSLSVINSPFKNYYYAHPEDNYIVENRSVDIDNEVYYETISAVNKNQKSKSFSYTGSIPLEFLFPLSQNINILDYSNYSLAIRELKIQNTRYARFIEDYFDRISIYPKEFLEIALGSLCSSEHDLQKIKELFIYKNTFNDYKVWNTQVDRNLKFVGMPKTYPDGTYFPLYDDRNGTYDPNHIEKLKFYTHSASNSDFQKSLDGFNNSINECIQYWSSDQMFAPRAWNEVKRLPGNDNCAFGDVLCYAGITSAPENQSRVRALGTLNYLNTNFSNNFHIYQDWNIIAMNSCDITDPKRTEALLIRVLADSSYDKGISVYEIAEDQTAHSCNQWGWAYSYILTNFNFNWNTKYIVKNYETFFTHKWRRSSSDNSEGISSEVDPSGLKLHSHEKITSLCDNLVNETYGPFNSIYYLQKFSLLSIMNNAFQWSDENSPPINPIDYLYLSKPGYWLNRQISLTNKIYHLARSDERFDTDSTNSDVFKMLLRKEEYDITAGAVDKAVAAVKAQVDQQVNNWSIFIGVGTNGVSFNINGIGLTTTFSNNIYITPNININNSLMDFPFKLQIVNQ